MNPTQSRLQIATRIHLLMLRELGQGIEVEQMLTRERYARDVLLVCEALRGSELAALAASFRQASAAALPPASGATAQRAPGHPGHVQQANDWSCDTSGFGLTRPPPRDDLPPEGHTERRRGWLPRWSRE